MDMEFPVQVKKIDPSTSSGDKYISYAWSDFRDGTETRLNLRSLQKEIQLL
jgi:hypothetical protein